jgi:hypothetical protein
VTPGPPAARVRAGVAAIPYASSAVWSCTRGVHVVVERRSIVSSGADYTRRPRLIPRDAHRLASSHTLMSRHVRSHSHAFPPLAARAMQGREETRNPRNSRQNDHSTGTIIIPRSIATPSGSGNPAGTSISLARYCTLLGSYLASSVTGASIDRGRYICHACPCRCMYASPHRWPCSEQVAWLG